MNTWIIDNWLWLGFATGSFWALVAFFLYTPWENLKNLERSWFNIGRVILSPAQQVALNFTCGFSGWFCIFIFAGRGKENVTFDGWSLSLLVVALLGVSGRLSDILYSVPDALKRYIKKKIDGSSNKTEDCET